MRVNILSTARRAISTSSTSSADTDGDGLSDLEEVTAGVRSGTDPNHPDTDGDGLIDGSDPDPLGSSEAETR